MSSEHGAKVFVVVVNDEGQYSIWDANSEVPLGWRRLHVRGDKSECLAYINSVWSDMRPLSVRRQA